MFFSIKATFSRYFGISGRGRLLFASGKPFDFRVFCVFRSCKGNVQKPHSFGNGAVGRDFCN